MDVEIRQRAMLRRDGRKLAGAAPLPSIGVPEAAKPLARRGLRSSGGDHISKSIDPAKVQ